MANKSIDTENGYEVLKDGYYVYFEKSIGKFHKWIFCDNVKPITDTIDFYPCTDSKIQAVHVFKTEKSAQKFIDEFCINFEEHDNLKIARIPNTLGEWYESKKSARKSMKESINGDCYIYYDDDDDGKRNVFCDYVKGITDTRDWFYLNEYIIDAIHIFKNEKQAQKFIDEHLKYFADQDKVVIAEYPQTVNGFFESKESETKSLKENRFDDLKRDIETLLLDDKVLKSLEGIDDNLELAYMLAERLDPSDYSMNDEDDLANEIKDMLVRGKIVITESKESTRKSIKEERYNVELSDYSGSIVDEETFDKKSDAIQWAKDNGRNCYARIWDNEEGKTVKEWKVKSIKESADDNWYKLKMLNEMLDAMEEDEYNIPKLGIYGVTKNINLDKGAIEALIKYYK